jgi:hypothetical protein
VVKFLKVKKVPPNTGYCKTSRNETCAKAKKKKEDNNNNS